MRLAPWLLLAALAAGPLPAAQAAEGDDAPPAGDAADPPAVVDFTGLGPAPLGNPRVLFEWGRKAREREGCPAAESAWLHVVDDFPDSEWAPPALYSVAVCLEGAQAWEEALSRYEQLRERYPDDPMVKDALFRSGLVLEELGRYKEAKKIYQGMLRTLELRLTPSDKVAVAVQRDIELIHLGRARKGVKRLLDHIEAYEALDRESQDPLRFWIAKCHVELGRVLSDHARTVPAYLHGWGKVRAAMPWNDDAEILRGQLDARARDLLAAQGRYQQAIELRQPEWTLAAIYEMGRDHEDLYRAFVGAPVPAGLDAGEAEEYQHQVMDRSYPILVKAYRIYYYGDHLARTQRSDSKYAVLLAERVHALDLEGITVDDLDLAPDVLKR